jgi:LAO/AO transport system kinase
MLKISEYIEGIRNSDRIILSQAITLVESKKKDHQQMASQIIEEIMPDTGRGLRIGITGVPGVGKSTFIEEFGLFLINNGKKVAVLSIDPTSTLSKGSILGDKTRMEALSKNPNGYIRPSPSGQYLGGVAQKTRESILLCEAAGFDIVLVETVGVGQSETTVRSMVDFFMLLMLAGGGDELQGIKRGIMEMADMVVINKVDGENRKQGEAAKREYERALHLFPPSPSQWTVPVLTASALKNEGIPDIWQSVVEYSDLTQGNGFFIKNRKDQNLNWFRESIKLHLEHDFYEKDGIHEKIAQLESGIVSGKFSIGSAIKRLFK